MQLPETNFYFSKRNRRDIYNHGNRILLTFTFVLYKFYLILWKFQEKKSHKSNSAWSRGSYLASYT